MAEQQETPEAAQPSAAVATTRPPVELPPERVHHGVMENLQGWLVEEGPWWLCSFVFHMVLFLGLALFATIFAPRVVKTLAEEAAPEFEEANVEPRTDAKKIERFKLDEAPLEPTSLQPDQLDLKPPAKAAQTAEYNDDSDTFVHAGGGVEAKNNQPALGGLSASFKGLGAGPELEGLGGLTTRAGAGKAPGSGGSGSGFGGRGQGHRKAMLGRDGPTIQSERSVAAALNWLARHQNRDGSWSLKSFPQHCSGGKACDGTARFDRFSAATAMALLPFLASGTTPDTRGATYRANVAKGIEYLIKNQLPDGDLQIEESNLYDHGLAAIALCECYGMSPNGNFGKRVRPAAQAALNFTMAAQDPVGGGWRYAPHDPGDTSAVGWQLMALKSGRMATLTVDEAVFAKSAKFLDSVCHGGKHGGLFCYMPDGLYSAMSDGTIVNGDLAVTAIGLLCRQYMGMARTDPAMIEGTAHLMDNLPDIQNRNTYYWYYATQVMHNQPGPEWDAWNRKMRRTLIESQCQDSDGCASGSWSPYTAAGEKNRDNIGSLGGRVMMTSLSALILEVYYRYLPLYKLDKDSGDATPVAKAAGGEKKPAKAEVKTKK
jgi:hypothetical protein